MNMRARREVIESARGEISAQRQKREGSDSRRICGDDRVWSLACELFAALVGSSGLGWR